MTKQKLTALFVSRSAQIVWCSGFVGWFIATGLFTADRVIAAIAWGLAGFMLCHLAHAVLAEWFVRSARAEIRAERVRFETQVREAVAMVKVDLQQWAEERGLGIDIEAGFGEPPSRWRQ